MPELKPIFSPKKGEKFWMMYAGEPVEATVISPPEWPNREDWRVTVPGHPEKVNAYFWNMHRTKKECLEYHVRDQEKDIEHCKERIEDYKGHLKEARKWHAKWKKMLDKENANDI